MDQIPLPLPKLTGLFLGAGASFELGMPLVWDLTNEIQNWLTPAKLRELNAGWIAQGTGFPEAVIADFELVLADPTIHYEAKLGYLQTQFMRSRGDAQHYHGLYSWLVQLVGILLHERHILNVPYITRGARFYGGIAGLAETHRPLWVFSLNHDVLLECIAAEFGVPVNCGLTNPSTLPLRNRMKEVVRELAILSKPIAEIEKHGFDFATYGERAINLMKVHGALDLFAAHDGEHLIKLALPGQSAAAVIEDLKASNDMLFSTVNGVRVKTVNEITYDDRDGVMQFLRRSILAGAYKFDSPLTQIIPKVMLDQFGWNLNHVSTLICIGYGFGDRHINDILRQWLELTAERKLVAVSPVIATLPNDLAHLRRQVVQERATATDYLEQFATRPMTLVDQWFRMVRTRVRDQARQNRGFA